MGSGLVSMVGNGQRRAPKASRLRTLLCSTAAALVSLGATVAVQAAPVLPQGGQFAGRVRPCRGGAEAVAFDLQD